MQECIQHCWAPLHWTPSKDIHFPCLIATTTPLVRTQHEHVHVLLPLLRAARRRPQQQPAVQQQREDRADDRLPPEALAEVQQRLGGVGVLLTIGWLVEGGDGVAAPSSSLTPSIESSHRNND